MNYAQDGTSNKCFTALHNMPAMRVLRGCERGECVPFPLSAADRRPAVLSTGRRQSTRQSTLLRAGYTELAATTTSTSAFAATIQSSMSSAPVARR